MYAEDSVQETQDGHAPSQFLAPQALSLCQRNLYDGECVICSTLSVQSRVREFWAAIATSVTCVIRQNKINKGS